MYAVKRTFNNQEYNLSTSNAIFYSDGHCGSEVSNWFRLHPRTFPTGSDELYVTLASSPVRL